MNGELVKKALQQVEWGEAGMAEAEVLRQALAELEVQRVAASGAGAQLVQAEVLAAVMARGYREGWADQPFMARQVAKVAEEIGELVDTFDFGVDGTWMRKVREAACITRITFNNELWGWENARVKDKADLEGEVADVLISLLCLAEVAGFDALEVVRRKALADVERGKRAGFTE